MDNHYFGLGFDTNKKPQFSNYDFDMSKLTQANLDDQKKTISDLQKEVVSLNAQLQPIINIIGVEKNNIDRIQGEITAAANVGGGVCSGGPAGYHGWIYTGGQYLCNANTEGIYQSQVIALSTAKAIKNANEQKAAALLTQITATNKLLEDARATYNEMVVQFQKSQAASASTDPTLNKQEKDAEIERLKIEAQKALDKAKIDSDAHIAELKQQQDNANTERLSASKKTTMLVGVGLVAVVVLVAGFVVFKKQMKKP